MKKYILSIFAVVLAVGMSAFTTVSNQTKTGDDYYWFNLDGTEDLGHDEFPNNGCTIEGEGCAKGYIDPPNDPTDDPADVFVREGNR